MTKERLREIKDSIDFQLRVCELHGYETDMIIEEKELYDEVIRLQKELEQVIEERNYYQAIVESWE